MKRILIATASSFTLLVQASSFSFVRSANIDLCICRSNPSYFQDSLHKKQSKTSMSHNDQDKVYMITEGEKRVPWDQRSDNFKGPVVLYDAKGNKKEEGVWEYNPWVGTYKSYYRNGNIRQLFAYDAFGIKNGIQNYYHQNGKLSIEGTFKDGLENGEFKYYDEAGKLTGTKHFVNGKPVKKKKN